MNLDRLLLQFAGRQFGLATREQLFELGFTRHQIDRRVASGFLEVVQPGVYRVAGSAPGYEQRVLAPLLAVRGLAVVSHRSAARLQGLRGTANYGAVDITIAGQSRPRVTNARVHRSAILDRYDIRTTRDGIPVTRPERTVIGYAAQAPKAAGRAIDSAILAGLTTYDRLWIYLTRYSGPGCPGSAAVKQALLLRDPREGPSESDLEDDWIEALAARGITGLVRQVPVQTEDGELRIDIGKPGFFAGFECDSRLWHSSEEDYKRERRKRYLLALAGYCIFPVTEFDLHERVDEVATDALRVFGEAA